MESDISGTDRALIKFSAASAAVVERERERKRKREIALELRSSNRFIYYFEEITFNFVS